MDATRRDTLGLVGAAAATALVGTGGVVAQPVKAKTRFWAAAVTPCDKSRKFDPGAMRDVLAHFKAQGADGVVILGTTGEFPSFTTAERKQVAEVVGKNKNGLDVMINPGTCALPDTIELAKHAVDNGADSLLVIPPYYFNRPPAPALLSYYSALFDQVRIPINLYHIPGVSEVPISIELLAALKAKYPNLAGIKDSSGNAEGYAAFVKAFPDLNMRTGTGNNIEHALDHGMGVILQEGNLFTRQIADVFTAFRAGRDYKAPLKKLRDAQDILGPLQWDFAADKYGLSLQMGSSETYQRWPNPDLTDVQRAQIRTAFAKIKDMG